MKTRYPRLTVLLISGISTVAQPLLTAQPLDASVSYTISERGDNHRVWQRITAQVDATGKTVYRTNAAYTELETGMHVKQRDGTYSEASDEIEITGTGGLAQKTRHRVAFAGNCNSPVAIDFLAADGQRLQSKILGLSYFDTATGQSVLIAELKDSDGQLLLDSRNEVIYYDALTDVKCDLRYRNSKFGLEQDLILRENLASPAEYKLTPATTRLQILTEFLNPPVPAKRERFVNGTVDEFLDFGDQKMGSGRVYVLGDEAIEIPVTKQWRQLNGRVFLIEEIPYTSVEPELKKLPARTASLKSSPDGVRHQVSVKRLLPPVKLAQKKAQPMKLVAGGPVSGKGLVLDYISASSTANYTFNGDTTYYVSGTVNLSGTNTIFEGGSVIKYSPTNTPKLSITSPITWRGAAYRPIVMTARDDASLGESIGNAALSGYYADTALDIDADSASADVVLQNIRISYAKTAIKIFKRTGHVISHAQFVNCQNAVTLDSATLSLRNALLHNVVTNFIGAGRTINGEHLTVDTATWLNYNLSSLTLTNSLLVGVANTGTFTSNSVSTVTAAAFQTVGAGNHYLAANTYRNAGTPTINASLAADLKKKTTYPPILLGNTVLVNTTLNPQAQRDTDTYDLGWHYDPIDYITWICSVTNATLTITNGTAIACYNDTGISLLDGGTIVSVGTPLALNRFVRYSSVQEQPVSLGASTPSLGININSYHYGSVGPNGEYRFSEFACPANGGFHIYHIDNWAYSNLVVQDCRFWNGANYFSGPSSSAAATVNNNLFNRSTITASGSSASATLSFSNNLVWGSSSVTIAQPGSGPWYAFNNAFDSTKLSILSTCTNGYNAYLNATNRITPTNVNDIVSASTLGYQSGTLGDFYQPINSSLINTGSVSNAGSVGLYHYTVTTNQVKETTSKVDIGFHYVATDANGVPIDTDSDGGPDYWEDRNGNGSVDSGETDWTVYNSPNGLSGGGGLQVFTPLK